MGAGFERAVAPLYVLALTGVVLVGQGPLGNVLLGTGRHRLVAFAALTEALVNLALSIVLVRRFGMIGVAIGTFVPVAITNLFVLMPAACRQVGIGILEFARSALAPPLAGAIPASLLAVALRVALPPASFAAVVAEGALVGAAFMVCACSFGLGTVDRNRYLEVVRRLAARIRLQD